MWGRCSKVGASSPVVVCRTIAADSSRQLQLFLPDYLKHLLHFVLLYQLSLGKHRTSFTLSNRRLLEFAGTMDWGHLNADRVNMDPKCNPKHFHPPRVVRKF